MVERHNNFVAPLVKHTTTLNGDWEPLESNPVIQVSPQSLAPSEQARMQSTGQSKQTDTAKTVAQGILIESVIVVLLVGLVAIGICAIVWLSGIVQAGPVTYITSVLVVWGSLGLLAYNHVSKRSHNKSPNGVEWHRISQEAGIAHHEVESRERIIMAAIERHHQREMKRLELSHEQ